MTKVILFLMAAFVAATESNYANPDYTIPTFLFVGAMIIAGLERDR